MAEPRVTYAPKRGATAEGELSALENAYAYIRRCAAEEKKKAAGPRQAGGLDSAKGGSSDPSAKPSLPR